MKVVLNWGERNTTGKFPVEGKDIASAAKFLNARDEWGKFEGHIPYKWVGGARGIVTKVTLTPSFKITMPTWRGYLKQHQDIKDDWDAMYKALRKHEDGHREIFESGVGKLVEDLKALGVVKGGDVETIISKAKDAIQEKYDSYDTKTEHGRLTGVELKIPQSK